MRRAVVPITTRLQRPSGTAVEHVLGEGSVDGEGSEPIDTLLTCADGLSPPGIVADSSAVEGPQMGAAVILPHVGAR